MRCDTNDEKIVEECIKKNTSEGKAGFQPSEAMQSI